MTHSFLALCLVAGALLGAQAHGAAPTRFVFGDAEAPAGHVRVSPGTPYDAGRGYGFEDAGGYFSVRLPRATTPSPSCWAMPRSRPRPP
ncbi:hypothetical protein [Massilia oculi]|uniref:hypothetical protein n=1 Tax=Massilia oculi TaxID=945844 RepID=UPI001E56BC1D|nr:hypothetical protein [Massilia oculi]